MDNLQLAKQKLKLLDIIPGKQEKKAGEVFINPCPICGKKDHFAVNHNKNLYTSYSSCCRGGSVIDYLLEKSICSNLKEAVDYVFAQTGIKKEKINRKQLTQINKNITFINNKMRKEKYIIYRCYHKLTTIEKVLRSIENKNLFGQWLLDFLETYTMRFVTADKDHNKLVDLCMNFKKEFQIAYDEFLKIEAYANRLREGCPI